jgi:hypothetical protein
MRKSPQGARWCAVGLLFESAARRCDEGASFVELNTSHPRARAGNGRMGANPWWVGIWEA